MPHHTQKTERIKDVLEQIIGKFVHFQVNDGPKYTGTLDHASTALLGHINGSGKESIIPYDFYINSPQFCIEFDVDQVDDITTYTSSTDTADLTGDAVLIINEPSVVYPLDNEPIAYNTCLIKITHGRRPFITRSK